MRRIKDIIHMIVGAFLVAFGGVAAWSVIAYNPWHPSLNTVCPCGVVYSAVSVVTHTMGDILWQWLGWLAPLFVLAIVSFGCALVFERDYSRWRVYLFIPGGFALLAITHVLGFEGSSGVLGYVCGVWLHTFVQAMGGEWWIKAGLALVAMTFLFVFAHGWRVLRFVGRGIKAVLARYRQMREKKQSVVERRVLQKEERGVEQVQDRRPSAPFFVAQAGRSPTSQEEGVPPTDVLTPSEGFSGSSMTTEQLKAMEEQLIRVMQEFGVQGSVAQVSAGPIVSVFEFIPAPGVKTARVVGLAEDVARAMSAHSVRISSLSGQNALGVEISNRNREVVAFKPLLEEVLGQNKDMRVPILLGRNIVGTPVVVDLASMPHLLVAGTTGSGKSVGLNVIITSLLFRFKADQCRFIMIDPKVLELSVYEGIPHLLTGVVTNPKNAAQALHWLVQEMEERYQLMAQVGVRNLEAFNDLARSCKEKGEPVTRKVQTGFDPSSGAPTYEAQEMPADAMPYIVAIVDEMADLMLSVGKTIEGSLQRLAQKARAAGIHVIMATQRPSVDVVTGTIKANFPSRLVFQVSSKIDSRTVIGEHGAEQLLGKGDMLYLSTGGRLQRVHGPFLSDADIASTVRWLQKHVGPPNLQPVFAPQEKNMARDDGEGGELYNEAKNIVIQSKKASTSFLQRKLQIGYNRAAMLIESLEENGVVSEADHVGRRRVLHNSDERG